METTVRAEPLRFYDGGTADEPPRRDHPPRIVLERRERGGQEVFAMLRRVGYADRPWGAATGWWRRGVAVGSLLLVAWLGWCASWDLLDRSAPLAVPVPWMPEAGLATELAHGAAGAVVVPLLLGLLWGRFRVAGAVLGVGLALLLHVTVLVAGLTLLYRAVEAVATRVPLLAGALVVSGVAASVVVVLDALV